MNHIQLPLAESTVIAILEDGGEFGIIQATRFVRANHVYWFRIETLPGMPPRLTNDELVAELAEAWRWVVVTAPVTGDSGS